MRLVHFSAWIGKRFGDPYFKKTFSDYGSWAIGIVSLLILQIN